MTRADREFLIADGLSLLGTRFVSVPAFLGLPFETVVVLSADNSLYYLHPLLKKLIAYDYGDKLDLARVKFSRGENGLYLVTKRGEVYTTAPFTKAQRYNTSLIKEGVFIKDIERLTWDNANNTNSTTRTYYIDGNNKIWNIVFDNKEQQYTSIESSFQAPGVSFIQLIQAHGTIRYILTEGGKLGAFNNFSAAKNYIQESRFQDPREKGWLHINGGKVYAETYGVNEDGELYYRHGEYIRQSNFQAKNSTIFFETTNFRVQANDKDKIFIKKYDLDQTLNFDLSLFGLELRSVAFIRSFLPARGFKITKKVSDKIISLCDLSLKNSVDPWTNLAMGINGKRQLVFQVSNNHCVALPLENEVIDYKFAGTDVRNAGDFSKIYIEINFTNGTKKKITPYSL